MLIVINLIELLYYNILLMKIKKKEQKKLNKVTVAYKIDEDEKKIKVLDEEFIKNNKGNCKLFINKKEYDICEYIEYKKYSINKNED